MAWYSRNRLYPVFEWLWRRLGVIWRYMRRKFTALVAYRPAFLPLRWRKDSGSREEPETESENRLPDVEKSLWEGGGHETVAPEEWPAESRREAAWKEPKIEDPELTEDETELTEDEDEDEFDSPKYRVPTSDELYCGYDSTWETEEQQRGSFRRTRPRHYKFSRFETAAKDMQNYRHDYPSRIKPQRWIKPLSNDKPNLNFYLGQKPSVPDGVFIHDFHDGWHGAYDTLEYVHSYIQWLFPLQEPGMNYEASPLTKEEIKEFLKSSTAKANLLKSYKLMLDFYGIKLCDEKTGEVKRARNWRERFHNLNSNTHNNLRITRILKCQGTLGFAHYQEPLVRFFLEQTLVHGELPEVKDSVLNYFVFAVLDKRQRRSLIKFAYLNYDRRDEFVWCPKKIQKIWSRLPVPTEPQKGADVEFFSSEGEADEEM